MRRAPFLFAPPLTTDAAFVSGATMTGVTHFHAIVRISSPELLTIGFRRILRRKLQPSVLTNTKDEAAVAHLQLANLALCVAVLHDYLGTRVVSGVWIGTVANWSVRRPKNRALD